MFFFLDSAKKALVACREFLNGLIDDLTVVRQKRAASGMAISGPEKLSDVIDNTVSDFNEKEDTVTDGVIGPEEMSKEVEARLKREIAGEGSRVMIVRGDGTVVDDDAKAHGAEFLIDSRSSSECSTPALNPGSRSTSAFASLAVRGRQHPHLRDGTTVDPGTKTAAEEDMEFEELDSPISFKPRRRSPTAAAAAAAVAPSTEKFPGTPSSAAIGSHPVAIRAKTPVAIPPAARPRRTSGYFSNSPNTTTSVSVSPTKSHSRSRSGSASSQAPHAHVHVPGFFTRDNNLGNPGPANTIPHGQDNASMSARQLTRRRTQMHLSLTTSSPHNPTHTATATANVAFPPSTIAPSAAAAAVDTTSPFMSPSVPSIRKRERATSHPDVFRLCQSWAERGPANDLVVIEANAYSTKS